MLPIPFWLTWRVMAGQSSNFKARTICKLCKAPVGRDCNPGARETAQSLLAQRPTELPGNHQSRAFNDGSTGVLPATFNLTNQLEDGIGNDEIARAAIKDPWPEYVHSVYAIGDSDDTKAISAYLAYGLFMTGQFTEAAAANRKALAIGPYPPATGLTSDTDQRTRPQTRIASVNAAALP